MRKRFGFGLVASVFVLAACGSPAAPEAGPARAEDPFRAQFLAACQVHPEQVRIETQSRGRIKTADYCVCIYDAATDGLSAPEKKVAAFYLMSQSGVSDADLQQFKDMDLTAMGTASAAIGKAVQRCPSS